MFETAYNKLRELRKQPMFDAKNKKLLYLENTRKRDKTAFIYELKDINQKVFYSFSANGFYFAMQYAFEWGKRNNAIITGTTLIDCKDYQNRTLKSNCDRC